MSLLDWTAQFVSPLQVAEAKPLIIQADVLQREFESCLKREYTPESLPLLLHQVREILFLFHDFQNSVSIFHLDFASMGVYHNI